MLYFRRIGIHPAHDWSRGIAACSISDASEYIQSEKQEDGLIDKDNEIDDFLKDELRAMQGEADTDKLEIERGILLNNVDSIKRTSME